MEWPLVLTTLGLVLGALGGVGALAVGYGMLKQQVKTLGDNEGKRETSINERFTKVETRLDEHAEDLADGRVKFAGLVAKLDHIAEQQTKILEKLDRIPTRG